MIRTLFLVLAIVDVMITPRPAHGWSGGHDHHLGHHFVGLIYGPFPYGPPCWRKDTGSTSTWTDSATPPTCPCGCRRTGAAGTNRHMLYVVPVKEPMRSRVPAITHVDGTARLQTVDPTEAPRYHRLIQTFGQATGVPVVLNTSFNLKGEPIVNSPAEAFSTFSRSGMDALILGNYIVKKWGRRNVNPNLRARISIAGELLAFLRAVKLWWLIPMVGSLLLIGVLIILAHSSSTAPFIYALF